jgi:hypothetical protein
VNLPSRDDREAIVASATENDITFRAALAGGIKSWRRFVISNAGSEVAAVLAMMLLVAVVTIVLGTLMDAPVSANGAAPSNQCASPPPSAATAPTPVAGAPGSSGSSLVRVSDASGTTGTLSLYTGRGNGTVERQSTLLSVQNGQLPANACLATAVSDLVRSDGQAIPASQVASWARVDNTGTRVTVYLQLSPRYLTVTPAGGYTGSVYLDDARATGGNVPVDIYIEYPFLWRATMLITAAAWIGFFWAWLVNLTRATSTPTSNRFWLYVVLQLAVLTAVTFPVLNAQILSNPDWTGDLSQYITLATLASGAALATTPTLRALIDRVVIPVISAGPGTPPAAAAAADGPTAAPPATAGGSAAGAGGTAGSVPSAPPATANGHSAESPVSDQAPDTAGSASSAESTAATRQGAVPAGRETR